MIVHSRYSGSYFQSGRRRHTLVSSPSYYDLFRPPLTSVSQNIWSFLKTYFMVLCWNNMSRKLQFQNITSEKSKTLRRNKDSGRVFLFVKKEEENHEDK